MAVAKEDRTPMQVPSDFHGELKAQSERLKIPMTTLVQFYGRAMIDAIKQAHP